MRRDKGNGMGYSKRNNFAYSRVTRELVEQVKDLISRYPTMTDQEIEDLTGWVSRSSINKIRNGFYDNLLTKNSINTPNENNTSNSILCEEVRTFRERYSEISNEQSMSIIDILTANNALLADIATMLVNHIESEKHKPSKACESHFRDQIKSNRR